MKKIRSQKKTGGISYPCGISGFRWASFRSLAKGGMTGNRPQPLLAYRKPLQSVRRFRRKYATFQLMMDGTMKRHPL